MFVALLLTTWLAGSAAAAQGAQVPTQAQAEELARQGNREAALEAFRRRAAENPNDLTARLWIGRLHLQMGHPDLAEPVYRSVMLEAPENVEALLGVGTSLVSLQRADEALLVLDRAARLDAKNADVLAALGAAHLRAFNVKLALSYLESAVAASPTPEHRQALEDAKRAHGHRIVASMFFEHFDETVPDTTNGNLAVDYRVADRLRVMARGQYQRKFDVSDQRGGAGLDWQFHPQASLHVHGLAGPDNEVLPRTDVFVQVAQRLPNAGWELAYRYVDFEGANVSVVSPGVRWFSDRASLALSYSLAMTNFDFLPDAEDGHTGTLDAAYRVQQRIWFNVGYTYGVDDFDTLSPDLLGRFRGHTAKGGFRIDMASFTTLIGRYDYQWRAGDMRKQRISVSLAQAF
jgi:YaiO family outer membrane protein